MSEDNMGYISKRIDEILESIKEIKTDLRATKQKLYDDTLELKLKQQKCDGSWSVLKAVVGMLGLGGIGAVLAENFIKLVIK